jgi:hypothetical protein
MLCDELQKHDKEVNRIYHEIELKILNEKESLEISIRLQNTLKLRRKTKYEISQMRLMLKSIGCENFKNKLITTKNKIISDEKLYIETFPLYKDIIHTDYHKLNKEGVKVH